MKNSGAHVKARVFLVDDHPIVRRALQFLLSSERDLEVCGEADTEAGALKKIVSLKPDVAIVDLSLKSGSGLELIKELRPLLPRLKILVFTMQAEKIHAERALHVGANGYLSKEEGSEKAVEAIRNLLQGRTFVSPQLSERMLGRISRISAGSLASESLSRRELQVLQLLGTGLRSREIAKELRLSMKTIGSHQESLKNRLDLRSASELMHYAMSWVRERSGGAA